MAARAHSAAPSRSRALRRWCAAAAAAVALTCVFAPAAAAKKATTTTSSTTTTTVPAAWDPRIQPIADKVAELRGLAFKQPVAASFLDDAAFQQQIAADLGTPTKKDKQDLARSQAQLRAIGLIGPDVDVREAVESMQASGVAAYYLPKKKTITVRGTNLDDVATRVTVAHELTHALQDQYYDLDKLDKDAETTHGVLALHTIAEGDAVNTADAFKKTLSPEEQQAYTARRTELGRQAIADIKAKGVPDALTFGFGAPYSLGPSMLQALVAREQSGSVDGLFANLPTADAVFVTPSSLVDHRAFQTVEPPALAKGEKRSGTSEQFGSLALFHMLSSRLDNATALTAADAWDGDSMVTFTRKGQSCLRAAFAGRGPEGTATITNALTQWATTMPAGVATVTGAPDRVTLTTCDPGAAFTPLPNNGDASMAFLANRNGLFSVMVEQGDSTVAATCTADTLLRDPVFAPVIELAGTDPTAEPDAATFAAVGARLREIRAQCQQT